MGALIGPFSDDIIIVDGTILSLHRGSGSSPRDDISSVFKEMPNKNAKLYVELGWINVFFNWMASFPNLSTMGSDFFVFTTLNGHFFKLL